MAARNGAPPHAPDSRRRARASNGPEVEGAPAPARKRTRLAFADRAPLVVDMLADPEQRGAGAQPLGEEEVLRACMRELRATNFVATGALLLHGATSVDVAALARKHFGVSHNVDTFSAAVVRLVPPNRSTCSVYQTGTVGCMGATTGEDAVAALQIFVRLLWRWGVKASLCGVRVDNVVSSVMAFPLNLRKLQRRWSSMVRYNRDNFPGATLVCSHLPMTPPTTVVMELFDTGKINMTGAKDLAEIQRAYDFVHKHVLVRIRADAPVDDDDEDDIGEIVDPRLEIVSGAADISDAELGITDEIRLALDLMRYHS